MDIFVYGTLKNGFSNHHIIRDSVFIGKDTTTDQYCMFDLGSFPAVVDTGNCCNIKGEVYCIDRDILNSLDILEGKFFTRKKVKLESNREAWMYFIDTSVCNTSNFPLIPDGVWNKMKTDKPSICYEAHGNLYLNITNQCSADCYFCIRNQGEGLYGYNLWLKRDPSEKEIIAELEKHDLKKYKEIVFTGFGEPTARFDVLLAVTRWLKAKGTYVRLDTNGHGQLINPGINVVDCLVDAGLDAVSVSLNAESAEVYDRICKPFYQNSYAALLKFAEESKKAGLHLRFSVVDVPEIDTDKCSQIARDMGVDFRIRG